MIVTLLSMGVVHDQPMKIFCDNKSAIYISTNPVFPERKKHIENDCHAVFDDIFLMKLKEVDKLVLNLVEIAV